MKKLSEIQVVVLMGGKGTRLGKKVPKTMIDVHGKPFFQYQLELMKSKGFKKFLFCIGYKGEVIKKYFKNGKDFGVKIQYSQDGETLLGTGGALRKALLLLENNFMVIYGDSYMDVDYLDVVDAYFKIKNDILMVIYKNKNKYGKSNVVLKDDNTVYYSKKQPLSVMRYIDYGITMINRNLIEKIHRNRYIDLAKMYHVWTSNQKIISGYEVYNRFYEIGTSKSLEEFKQYVNEKV